ncbi:hypothetical protein O181_129815 [Austropuccinia psidii MF-1]|uniref:Uncharacterized protein n=1 Tax=Austropuccinia psidii MF-1 TaxID=1389203 RepID=A0A9Q3KXU1_9BASI|nr:hypothetical protein [Austropuccinia psidii MF-1]
MSEFMIHRKTWRQCGGDLEHAVEKRTTEQSSAEDIINILKGVTTRTRIGSSRVNLKTRFNTPWEDFLDKNPKENSNNMKYESADIIRKIYICQSTTHVANSCSGKGKIYEIEIENKPDVEKDGEVIEENSDENHQYFLNLQNIRKYQCHFLHHGILFPLATIKELSALFITDERCTTNEDQTKQGKRLYSW